MVKKSASTVMKELEDFVLSAAPEINLEKLTELIKAGEAFEAEKAAVMKEKEIPSPTIKSPSKSTLVKTLTKESIDTKIPANIAKALNSYTDELNKVLEDSPKLRVTLPGPQILTVLKTSRYGRKAHIGGEQFHLERIYFGKKGTAIGVFEPLEVSPYKQMEMDMGEAINLFGRDFSYNLSTYAEQISIPKTEVFSGQPDVLDPDGVEHYKDFGSW